MPKARTRKIKGLRRSSERHRWAWGEHAHIHLAQGAPSWPHLRRMEKAAVDVDLGQLEHQGQDPSVEASGWHGNSLEGPTRPNTATSSAQVFFVQHGPDAETSL